MYLHVGFCWRRKNLYRYNKIIIFKVLVLLIVYNTNNILLIKTLDVDECALASTNDCSTNADCSNTVGSFNCTCKSGFAGNGNTCEGITRS